MINVRLRTTEEVSIWFPISLECKINAKNIAITCTIRTTYLTTIQSLNLIGEELTEKYHFHYQMFDGTVTLK